MHDAPAGWQASRRLRDPYRAPEVFLEAAAAHGLLDHRLRLDSLCDATEAELEARTASPLMRLVRWSLRCRGQLRGDTAIEAWSRAFQALVAEGSRRRRAADAAHVLLKQLHLEFGPPSPSVERPVRTASEAELDALTERMLTATSLEELFVDHPALQAPSTS